MSEETETQCTTQLSTLEKDGDLRPHSHPVWAPQRHRTGDLKGIYTSAMLWKSSRGQRAYKECGVFLAGHSIVQQRTMADPYSVIAYYTCTLSLQQIHAQKIPRSHTSLLKSCGSRPQGKVCGSEPQTVSCGEL